MQVVDGVVLSVAVCSWQLFEAHFLLLLLAIIKYFLPPVYLKSAHKN